MDEINRLHDDLLVKVLTFLPTKVAIRTSILAKRWKFLWMWLPKLEYFCNESESERLQSFINMNLRQHKAAAIESLRLNLRPGGSIKPEDVEHWVAIAVSRCVHELSLNLFIKGYGLTKLPSSLYTCKTLVLLKLEDEIIVDVPRMICLPSLKNLILRCVTYSDENTLHQLLSNCPVLEDLVVETYESDHFKTLSITVPSLQRLTLKIFSGNNFDPLVINTPSLNYLHFSDYDYKYDSDSYSFDFKDMPKLEEVDIDLSFHDIDKFVRSIRFVKRLSLCVHINTDEAVYRDGIVFNQLEHLKLCSCDSIWSKGLAWLLKDSPNLRELEVYLNDEHKDYIEDPPFSWQNHDIKSVPQCLVRSLETFKWTGIKGLQKGLDLVKYILRNACCLKTATILFHPEAEDNFETMKLELSQCVLGSSTCQLVINRGI